MPDVSDARHIAVFQLTPLDSIATELSGDDFAKLVVFALVRVSSVAHRLVYGAHGAKRAQDDAALCAV